MASNYDAEELLTYGRATITKEVIFNKVKGLGWSQEAFGKLTDEQMIEAMDKKRTPAMMGISLEKVFVPKAGSEDEVGELPEFDGMDSAAEGKRPAIVQKVDGVGGVSEAGVKMAAFTPPSYAKERLDPTVVANPAVEEGVITPVATAQPERQASVNAPAPIKGAQARPAAPAGPRRPINVKPPKANDKQVMSTMDAAFTLSQNEATIPQAKALLIAFGLLRPFQTLYPDAAKKVIGRADTAADPTRRGAVILDVEINAEDGYVHIVTSDGLLTITGHELVQKGNE